MNERPEFPPQDPEGPANPYAPPQAPLLGDPGRPEDGTLRPVPFEDLAAIPGFWARVWAMFGLVFTRPLELLERVPATESLSAPWRFNMLLVLPYLLFMGLIFALVFGMAGIAGAKDPNMPPGLLAGIVGGEFFLIALFMTAGMFIWGALIHASLWIWGATREGRGLVQTLRTIGYGSAFLNLLLIVPCLGPLAALVGWVFLSIGLARVHRTETWRSVCAVLVTPFVLCCGLYALIFAMAFGAAAMHH